MSVSWEMTEQDFEDVKHLLPQSVVAMITVIGLEATFHMVKVWGGTNYPISNPPAASSPLFSTICAGKTPLCLVLRRRFAIG